MFRLLHIFTIISYYFYSTDYISLKRNEIRKGKEQIPGATEISPSCSAAVYRMGRQEITHNAIWVHPQCTLDGIVYMYESCVWPGGGGG